MRIFSCHLVKLLLFAALCSRPATASETEDRLMDIKKRLPFLTLGSFLPNGQPREYERKAIIDAWQTLSGLRSPELQTADLVKLSEHADAGIRILALLALVAKETPDFVPACIRLVDDHSPTIPAEDFSGDFFDKEMQTRPQTVADVARRCLGMVECEFLYPNKALQPEAEAWWKLRQSNTDWLGWYRFLYARACHGKLPPQEEAKPAVKEFRRRVDRLPPKTRAWLLLYLSDDVFMTGRWQDWFATEQEMISAIRELGAAALIEFLQTGRRPGLQNPAIDDPKKGTRFIITYAKHFFTAASAHDLLALKQYTAAMDADPLHARQVKDEAMNYFRGPFDDGWEGGKVMAALVEHGDETDRATAVQWFYSQVNDADRGSTAQSVFLHGLEQRLPREGKDVIKRLVSEPAFDRLNPYDVLGTAYLLEKFAGDFSFDHTWRDDKADDFRNLLRAHFGLVIVTHKELKLPEKHLEKPEWSVELGGLGHSLVINPGGTLLAVGMKDRNGGARVLDATNGKEKTRITKSDGPLEVFFTHDGTHLLFDRHGDSEGVRTWNLATGEDRWHDVDRYSSFRIAADEPFGIFDHGTVRERFTWVDMSTLKTLWSRDHPSNRNYVMASRRMRNGLPWETGESKTSSCLKPPRLSLSWSFPVTPRPRASLSFHLTPPSSFRWQGMTG